MKTLIVAIVVMSIVVVLMAIKILLKKGGTFPNTHISSSKVMKERGISCWQSQDREMQQDSIKIK